MDSPFSSASPKHDTSMHSTVITTAKERAAYFIRWQFNYRDIPMARLRLLLGHVSELAIEKL